MSAETEISNLLSSAAFVTRYLSGRSNELVAQAVGLLTQDIEIPRVYDPAHIKARGIVNFDELKFAPQVQEKTRPGLPTPPEIDLGDKPTSVRLNDLDIRFPDDLSKLTLPTFEYGASPGIPEFNVQVPNINTEFSLDNLPPTAVDYFSQRINLEDLPTFTLNKPTIKFAPVEIDNEKFDKSVFDLAYNQVKDDIDSEANQHLEGIHLLAKTLYPLSGALVSELNNRFSNRYSSGYLETMISDQLQNEKTRVLRVIQDHSGWDIPDLARNAMLAQVTEQLDAWIEKEVSQQLTHDHEQAVGVVQAAGETYQVLLKTAADLKIKQLSLLLENAQTSVLLAKKTVLALYQAYEMEIYTQQEINIEKQELKLSKARGEFQLGMADYEFKMAEIAQQQAIQQKNKQDVLQYRSDVRTITAQTGVVSALQQAKADELKLKNINLTLFAEKIKAYDQQVNGYIEGIRGQIAGISEYEDALDGKLKLMDVFEAKVAAFDELIQAKMLKTQAEQQRNEAELERYQAEFTAALAQVELSQKNANFQVASYEADAVGFIQDARLATRQAQAESRFMEKESDAALEAYRINQEQILDVVEANLKWITALADVNKDGAGIYANLAQGAMSAANGIANVIFSESA